MTISAATVWEVRTTGAQTNGGGFKAGATGTDFSQQAAAQYDIANADAAGAGEVILTAQAAAAMVGNIAYFVGGTHVTVGWYEIISVVAGASLTVDRQVISDVGHANVHLHIGGAFKFGGALDDEFTEAPSPGNVIYVRTGTYALGENVSQAKAGTAVAPISWIGYKSIRDDLVVRTDRPLFECGGYSTIFGDYSIHKNFRFKTTSLAGLSVGTYSIIFNCKSQNTSALTYAAITLGSGSRILFSEAICDNGIAINTNYYCRICSCYVHDSKSGIVLTFYGGSVILSVIDTCTLGINCSNAYGWTFANNTIYNCTMGISGINAYAEAFINNIITDCTIGASWTTNTLNNFWDYNCWNNTTDVVNVTKGPHDITADPKLKDPANDDFTLKGGSPCFAAGLSLNSDVGLP